MQTSQISSLFLARLFLTLNYDNCNIPQHFCDCPKQGHGFPTLYIVVLLLMLRPKKNMCVSDWVFKIRVGRSGFFFFKTYNYAPSSKITQTCFFLSFLLQFINYLTCSTMFFGSKHRSNVQGNEENC